MTDPPNLAPLERPSVAVLPFVASEEDFDGQAFADGLTEHLSYTLACTPGLFVSGRNSAFTFKGRSVPAAEVGLRLGVAHVLQGMAERINERVVLTASLSAVDRPEPLWTERLEGEADAIFAFQDRIAERAIGAIGAIAPDASIDRSGIERTRFPADAGVYAKFLSAYSNYAAGSEESIRSLASTLDAIARMMPDHPLPLALKAQCYTYLVVQGWSDDVPSDAGEGLRLARRSDESCGDGEPGRPDDDWAHARLLRPGD